MRVKEFFLNMIRAPFAAALGAVAVLSGLRGLTEPATLPLQAVIGDLGYAWAVVYGLGGLAMLWGMGRLKPKYEAAGCMLFSGGTAVQAFVTAFFLGVSPLLSVWSVTTLLIFAVAGLLRVRHLIRGQQLVWLGGQ
jgi:hypothetical protein